MMEERQRQTLSSSPSPSPRSTAGGGGEGGARVQLPEVDPQGNEAHTINSSSTFRGIVSTARHIKRDNVKVDNDTYELATSTKDPSYAQATLSWGGVQNRNESTTVEQQTPAVQQQICNDIMHMIGNVLAKGGPAHISSQDPFVLKFAGHYLKVLKANDSTIKYNLPPGAPIATADDIRTFNGYIDNYHKRAHSEDVKAWMDDRIAALPKREEHESDLPIGYGASGTSLRNR